MHAPVVQPIKSLEEWDEFVATCYRQGKSQDKFRDYQADANPTVTEFYRQNHAHQTPDFVPAKNKGFGGLRREKKSIWEMAEFLNTLVDESDPDTDLTHIEHLLQTSEAIRSFYPAHKHGGYGHVMNSHDETMFEWVRKFNADDLYSKGTERPRFQESKPYYEDLVLEFFPDRIAW